MVHFVPGMVLIIAIAHLVAQLFGYCISKQLIVAFSDVFHQLFVTYFAVLVNTARQVGIVVI